MSLFVLKEPDVDRVNAAGRISNMMTSTLDLELVDV